MIVREYQDKKNIVHCYDCPLYYTAICNHRAVKEEKRRAAKANNYLCPLEEISEE